MTDTAITVTLTVIRGVALLLCLLFIYKYSRVRWERSPEGVNTMFVTVALAMIATLALVRGLVPFQSIEVACSFAAWLGVGALMVHRIRMLTMAQRNRRNRANKESNSNP